MPLGFLKFVRSDRIAQVYKGRCIRIQLSAAAAAAALAPPPEGSSNGEEEDPNSAAAAAAARAAAAPAAREIVAALAKPKALVLVDGLLQPRERRAVREGLALGLSSKLHVLDSQILGRS